MKLRDAIEHYVEWRQLHGAKFVTARNLLRQFLHFADGDAACEAVTKAQVLGFLAGKGPVTRHRENKTYALAGFWRFAISRGYARRSPLPDDEPRSLLRPPPYVYTRDELRRLLDPKNVEASRSRARKLDADTFRTLLLLLYGAGLRFSEATGLTVADVNLPDAILTIRDTKFYKSRVVPIGPQLAAAIESYMSRRLCDGRAQDPSSYLLMNRDRTRLASSTVHEAFDALRRIARVHGTHSGREVPRLHDLRHSFAVHRLTAWYRQGADVQRLLPSLSTYLGHSDLEGTKVHLTMTPELLQQASLRFGNYAGGGANARS